MLYPLSYVENHGRIRTGDTLQTEVCLPYGTCFLVNEATIGEVFLNYIGKPMAGFEPVTSRIIFLRSYRTAKHSSLTALILIKAVCDKREGSIPFCGFYPEGSVTKKSSTTATSPLIFYLNFSKNFVFSFSTLQNYKGGAQSFCVA